MALTDAQRAQLGAIADQLIPAGGGMPSASEAGVSGQYLDEVLTSLPDLGDALDTTLASVDGLDPAEAIAVLRQDPAGWGVLTAVVPGAYFMNPAIRAAIGYPGLERRPIDPDRRARLPRRRAARFGRVARSRLSPHAD